jgi:hypothetical protein
MDKEKQIDGMIEAMSESCGSCFGSGEAECIYNAGYRKATDVAREFRQRMNEKMGKHTHLLGKEYVQRIMREIEKEFSEEGK